MKILGRVEASNKKTHAVTINVLDLEGSVVMLSPLMKPLNLFPRSCVLGLIWFFNYDIVFYRGRNQSNGQNQKDFMVGVGEAIGVIPG